jgi:hypothetical protein
MIRRLDQVRHPAFLGKNNRPRKIKGSVLSRINIIRNIGQFDSVNVPASVTFPTASQAWGTISYLGVFDALATGTGNLWFFIPMVRTTSDGVLTAGSTTVSSATMAFTSSDVGQVISGQGIPIGATILSQTGTACVISAEAEVSATGVVLTVGTPKVVSASESLTMPVGSLLVELG